MNCKGLFFTLGLLCAVSLRADFTSGLLARWSFNDTSSEEALLTDDIGGIRLKKSIFGKDDFFHVEPAGTIQLGGAIVLAANAVHSDSPRFAKLSETCTIYCRIKYGPLSESAFNFGLVNSLIPTDWPQLIFTELSKPQGIAVRAKGTGKLEAGMGSGHLLPREAGWSDVAIIFDGRAKKVGLYVDGKVAERHSPMNRLDAFRSLMLGRLKQNGTRRIELDEVRIYDSALSPEWIAEIEPLKSGKKAEEKNSASRLVLEDFSDVGTWRTWEVANTTPGRWFAADLVLSATPDASRDDGFAGKLKFDFADAAKTGKLDFCRAKASLPQVFADAVEFDADSRNIRGRFAFTLEDSIGRKLRTRAAELGPAGWRRYRSPITIRGFTPPYRLHKIHFEADGVSGKGELLIDDIAFTGGVSSQRMVTIRPELAPLASEPGRPLHASYRLRSASAEEVSGDLSITLRDELGRSTGQAKQAVKIPAFGSAAVKFELPAQQIGSYHAEVIFTSDRCRSSYLDWFAVFQPNNGRKNHTPMWFGIQDTVMWNGETENALHNRWKKLAGFDIERFCITGGRIETGTADSFPAIRRYMNDYEKLGMLACISYTDGVPAYTQKVPKYRAAPTILPAFRSHMEKVFGCFKFFDSARYFEFWNEPDLDFYNGTFEDYLAALRVIREARDAVAPAIRLTTGGVTIKHPREKKNFSRNTYIQAKEYYDIASFHAHGSLMDYVERQEKVEAWLAEAGKDVPICNTETGDRAGYAPETIRRQAGTLARKIIYAKSRNSEFYIWFTLQDYWDMDPEADDSFGLVTSDNRPKPSFVVYNELIRRLGNTGRGEKLSDKQLDLYRFRSRDGKQEILSLWPRISGTRQLLSLEGSGPLEAVDLYGRKIPITSYSGYAAIPVDDVIYISYPAGCYRLGTPIAVQNRITGCPAGGIVNVEIRVRNPFDREMELQDARGRKILKPDETILLPVPFSVPANAVNGMLAREEKVKLTLGTETMEWSVPVTVNVCYPVAKGTAPAAHIELKTLDKVCEMSFDPHIPRWMGPKDLSCSFGMSRRNDHLLLSVDVADDRHVMNSLPENGWRDDSIQIAFSSLDGKYTELTLSGRDGKGAAYAHIAYQEDLKGIWKVPVSVIHRNGITRYRAELPLAKLGILNRSGTLFRFAFLVNENDGKGRIRWIEWMGGIGRAKNPDEFGWGVLN